MAQDDLARGMARADLCRFLAACYYEPGPEFAEEKLFDSIKAAASRVHPDLAAGARRLGEAFAAEEPEALLIDYTRLFLGPVDTLAKPYGSIWLRRDNMLMEESTVAVQLLYAEGGFDIDDGFRELPDHVAAELEFLYLLIFRETEAQGKGDLDALATVTDLRQRFLAANLGACIGPSLRRSGPRRPDRFLPRARRPQRALRPPGGRTIRRPLTAVCPARSIPDAQRLDHFLVEASVGQDEAFAVDGPRTGDVAVHAARLGHDDRCGGAIPRFVEQIHAAVEPA